MNGQTASGSGKSNLTVYAQPTLSGPSPLEPAEGFAELTSPRTAAHPTRGDIGWGCQPECECPRKRDSGVHSGVSWRAGDQLQHKDAAGTLIDRAMLARALGEAMARASLRALSSQRELCARDFFRRFAQRGVLPAQSMEALLQELEGLESLQEPAARNFIGLEIDSSWLRLETLLRGMEVYNKFRDDLYTLLFLYGSQSGLTPSEATEVVYEVSGRLASASEARELQSAALLNNGLVRREDLAMLLATWSWNWTSIETLLHKQRSCFGLSF